MRFRTLVVMTALATMGGHGIAAAQQATAPSGQVYNNSPVAPGSTPVFIAPPVAATTYYNSSSSNSTEIPRTPLKTAAEIDERAKMIEQHNQVETQKGRDKYFAAYEASKADAARQAAAAKQAEAAALKGNPATAGANGQAAPGAYVPPPVFTGKKKTDSDKPVRLFNVQ